MKTWAKVVRASGQRHVQFQLHYPTYLHGQISQLALMSMVNLSLVSDAVEDLIASCKDKEEFAIPDLVHVSEQLVRKEGAVATEREFVESLWCMAAQNMSAYAEAMTMYAEPGDPIIRRLLMPFTYSTFIASCQVGWDKFLNNRNDKKLHKEVHEVFDAMWEAKCLSMI